MLLFPFILVDLELVQINFKKNFCFSEEGIGGGLPLPLHLQRPGAHPLKIHTVNGLTMVKEIMIVKGEGPLGIEIQETGAGEEVVVLIDLGLEGTVIPIINIENTYQREIKENFQGKLTVVM